MTKQLRWLHLSDIHLRGKSKLDQNDAFTRIRADLAKRTAAGNAPDLIFVSGDLVFSGQPGDFKEILNRLDDLCGACKLSRDRVFFCPGNHDSDISVAPVLLLGCWTSLKDIAAFQSFLESPEFQVLSGRQAAYRDFVKAFRGASAGFDTHGLHSQARIEVGDLVVGVLSVNSSLLANGGPDDHGKLQVCVRSLEEPCERLQTCDVRFVLIHHPFEWLAAFESDRAEALIFDSGDIILRGHVHQRKLIGSLRGGIASTAGAVWDGTAGDYEYSYGLIECDSLTCTIESVRYMQQTGDWMVNVKTAAISRDRDERCTPSSIWTELKATLHYPAQIAAVLSGYSSELIAQIPSGPTYLSTERILAEHVASGVDVPALGVIRVSTLLTFYGHERLDSVLRSERDVLQAYDQMLESESQRDAGLAALVRSREQAADRIVRSTPDQVDSWSDRYIRRLVSEGDSNAIVGLQDSVGSGSLRALKSALADGARDPYEAWLKIGGPSLEFGELAAVTTRLASSRTADLAATALNDAAERFPVDARRLDDIARVIAIEAGDPGIYERFRKATVRQ
jgi:predicted MPP superfamily phosphohydrolase